MKRLFLLGLALLPALCAQTPPITPVPPLGQAAAEDPVVAVVEGKPFRKSELEMMARSMGANISRNYFTDKRAFLRTFALMVHLADLAKKEGLDKEGPDAWRLYYNNLLYLANARAGIQNTRVQVAPGDQEKYYALHKLDFASARVKVIYLSFNDNPPADAKPPKPRTSAEAETLANDLVKQARAGADFAALAEKHSDDADSKAKKGDFTPIKPADSSLPAPIKAAIFALKAGQVSDPVRQAGGFWIFRMEAFVTPAYDEVRDDIFRAIQDAQFRAWMETVQKEVKVEFKDDKYLDDKTMQ